jgi:uncharacterized membrane protein
MLEEGRLILASGGLLLFFTDFVGITMAAILTLFLAGAVQTGCRRRWFLGGATATAGAIVAILTPLTLNFDKIASGARFEKTVYDTAIHILRSTSPAPVIIGLTIDGAEATITLRPLPLDAAEQKRLTDELQRATRLQISLRAANLFP